jgi:dihydropteroate synthase
MGVINTTPDSFSDGGSLYRDNGLDLDLVLFRAQDMLREGAQILDIGGESTRPGARPVSSGEEMERVLPVVERLAQEFDALISVDTSSPQLMREAVALGAGMMNDVRALSRPGAVEALVELDVPVCLMHMQGAPDTMQDKPRYADVVAQVMAFLEARVDCCLQAGIKGDRLILDPGFGFGKSVTHNLQLLEGLPRLAALGYPLLVGLSRKSLIGTLLGREVDQRMPASLGLAVLAAERGAGIIRTHDVGPTADAVAMVKALQDAAEKTHD